MSRRETGERPFNKRRARAWRSCFDSGGEILVSLNGAEGSGAGATFVSGAHSLFITVTSRSHARAEQRKEGRALRKSYRTLTHTHSLTPSRNRNRAHRSK